MGGELHGGIRVTSVGFGGEDLGHFQIDPTHVSVSVLMNGVCNMFMWYGVHSCSRWVLNG